MPDERRTNSTIINTFEGRTPLSRERYGEALDVFPSGIVHDSRKLDPYPIYVDHAAGSRKWDLDGNEYIDYYGGHGSLLLGHCHPQIMEAVHTQIDRGSHPAASHELELEWGKLVQRLVRCAERVRFTSSGTEANLMAFRLARAQTGRDKIVRFKGHFHGWQDHVAFGVKSHQDGTPTPGVLEGIAEGIILLDPNDIVGLEYTLRNRDDVAAVILEPTGASSGQMPVTRDFVEALRRETQAAGTILIFDEVVTGFRLRPGGAQAHWDITPDMATFAKVLAGGMPGGCVTGREDILAHLDFEKSEAAGREKIGHQGTYNANPVSAAAGVAMLRAVAEEGVCEIAAAQGEKLRAGMNKVFAEEGVAWAAYGDASITYLHTNPVGRDIDPENFDKYALPWSEMAKGGGHPSAGRFRLAMMNAGVDLSGKPGMIISAVHSDDDINETCEALRSALTALKEEGDL